MYSGSITFLELVLLVSLLSLYCYTVSLTVMESKANHLVISKKQSPNGEDIVNLKGALYLYQKLSKVMWLQYVCNI